MKLQGLGLPTAIGAGTTGVGAELFVGAPDGGSDLEAARRGAFKRMIVTSRIACPEGATWREFETIETHPLTRDQLPDYARTYAPDEDDEEVLAKLEPMLKGDQPLSPLFARFAIEQVTTGVASSARTSLDLALHYVEALRAGKLDLSADDMMRASGIAAFQSVREALSPREVDGEYLRGVFASEAERTPFMAANQTDEVTPASLVSLLEGCGLVVRNPINRRLQFAYDPVAELLAAWHMIRNSGEQGIGKLIGQVRKSGPHGLADALNLAETV